VGAVDMIKVERKNEEEFAVTVEEGGSRTRHVVTVDEGYYEKLTQKMITKEELIKRSFEFLLKRESKESILSRFNLKVIKRYFPEYEGKVKLK
jgi:hypothetical protein